MNASHEQTIQLFKTRIDLFLKTDHNIIKTKTPNKTHTLTRSSSNQSEMNNYFSITVLKNVSFWFCFESSSCSFLNVTSTLNYYWI